MYEIVISKSAEAGFLALSEDMQDRVEAVLKRISMRPHRYVTRLTGSRAYRLRVGKYRIILDIDEREKRIEVLRIGHREKIYS